MCVHTIPRMGIDVHWFSTVCCSEPSWKLQPEKINETSLESTHGINQEFHVLEASNVAQSLLDCLLACQPSIFAAEDLRKTVMQEASCVLRWSTASVMIQLHGLHGLHGTWNLIPLERQCIETRCFFVLSFVATLQDSWKNKGHAVALVEDNVGTERWDMLACWLLIRLINDRFWSKTGMCIHVCDNLSLSLHLPYICIYIRII